jgi:hypothetical protein
MFETLGKQKLQALDYQLDGTSPIPRLGDPEAIEYGDFDNIR